VPNTNKLLVIGVASDGTV